MHFCCNFYRYFIVFICQYYISRIFDISIYHFAEQPFTHKTDLKDTVAELVGSYQIQDATLKITRGDYSPILNRVVRRLESAKVAITESFAFAALLRGNWLDTLIVSSFKIQKTSNGPLILITLISQQMFGVAQ